MKLKRILGKSEQPRRAWREAPSSPPPGANPQSNTPPDLANRRRFLERHILIHTHVPKTAGSTLSHALAGIVGGANAIDLRLRRAVRLRELSTEDRAGLRCISGHFVYGLHTRFDQIPLYMAAIREPVSRAISDFRFNLRNPNHRDHARLQGTSFEEAWDLVTGKAAHARYNEQSRILCGLASEVQPTREMLLQRLENDYFLIIPQQHMGMAIRDLRAAFGLPWTKIPLMNPAQGPEVEITAAMRDKVRAANQLDIELCDRVEAAFPARLARACAYIAENCLRDRGREDQA